MYTTLSATNYIIKIQQLIICAAPSLCCCAALHLLQPRLISVSFRISPDADPVLCWRKSIPVPCLLCRRRGHARWSRKGGRAHQRQRGGSLQHRRRSSTGSCVRRRRRSRIGMARAGEQDGEGLRTAPTGRQARGDGGAVRRVRSGVGGAKSTDWDFCLD